MKGKMKKVWQRVRSLTLAAAFSTWRSETSWSRHLLHMELEATVHYERCLRRRSVRQWDSHVRERKRVHLSALMKQAVMRIQHDEMSWAFWKWREHGADLRRQQLILQRAVARIQHRTLAVSFLHFRGVVRWRRRSRRIVENFRERSHRRVLEMVSLPFKLSRLCLN